jgi:hypothetical protein
MKPLTYQRLKRQQLHGRNPVIAPYRFMRKPRRKTVTVEKLFSGAAS